MKLNILILLLLSVATYSQKPRLHNVIQEIVPTKERSQFEQGIPIIPSQLIVEKTGELWTKTVTQLQSTGPGVYDDACGRREGWVVLVHPEHLEYASDGQQTSALHGQQIFVELDTRTITFFRNHNFNAVMATYQLKDLAPPVVIQDWSQFHCFQLELQNFDLTKMTNKEPPVKSSAHPSTTAVASICTGSEDDMREWMKDIQIFPRCQLLDPTIRGDNNILPAPEGSQLNGFEEESSSYSKTNSMSMSQQSSYEHYASLQSQFTNSIKALQQTIKHKQEFEMRKDIDIETETLLRNHEEESQEEQQTIIEKSTKMIDVLATDFKRQSETRRESYEESLELSEEADRLREEKECLQGLLDKKREAEADQVRQLIEEDNITSESQTLDKAAQRLKAEQQKKFQEEQAALSIENSQKQAEIDSLKKTMVDVVFQATSNVYDQKYCVNDSDGGDIGQAAFLTQRCSQFNQLERKDAALQATCTDPRQFCSYCCSLFIGTTLLTERSDCAKECNNSVVIKNEITPNSNGQTQAPVTQAPVTQEPVTQAPVTQEPVTQAPVTQEPVTKKFL